LVWKNSLLISVELVDVHRLEAFDVFLVAVDAVDEDRP